MPAPVSHPRVTVCVLAFASVIAAAEAGDIPQWPTFERDVMPILAVFAAAVVDLAEAWLVQSLPRSLLNLLAAGTLLQAPP